MKDFNQSILATAEVKEILGMFASHGVRYLIIGGCAVMWYSGNRYTRNIDIWTDRCSSNAKSVFDALKEYGAPLASLSHDDFTQPGFFYQMGRPPLRIDDMPGLFGVPFDDAWKERESMFIDGVCFFFISRRHLIEAKLAAGRPQDIIDVQHLVDGIHSSKRLL
ncbi:MAG: hypothetical protein HGB04_04385 [Chlorobiaceae bacterium]|nr:hypothetical protein [Chlorobiaceae bacterium]